MNRNYSAKSVRFMGFPTCFENLCKSVKYERVEVKKHFRIETKHAEALKELDPDQLPLVISFVKKEGVASIQFSVVWTILDVEVEGFDSHKTTELYQIIEDGLDLKKPTEEERRGVASFPSMMSVLWKIHDKVEEISKMSSDDSTEHQGRARCFVSFRFDDHSKALAFELKEFLELVGVDFVSGLGYEPRSISEKVLGRLAEPLDLFIVIFSSTGDSAWLNQEIGVARGRKISVLVLKEEASDADFGMLGDTEYLSFPRDMISRTFVGVLQALSYLDRSKRS
jgi:hypothetical protein